MNQESGINHNISYEIESHKISKYQKIIFSRKYFFCLVFFFLLSTFLFWNEVYRAHTSFSGFKTVEVVSGMGSRRIASLLKQEGIIRSKWAFVIHVSLRGAIFNLKPGRYIFDDKSSIEKIVQKFINGGVQEVVIIIPEGWNLLDMADYFERLGLFKHEEILRLVNFEGAQFDFLRDKPRFTSFEGYLFPDTYRIFINAAWEDIILKMFENFDKKLDRTLREEIIKSGKTIHEVITMASLIEKEVVSEEDRSVVSGILWKRVKLGIPLQVDAVLVYIKRQIKENPEFQDVISGIGKMTPSTTGKISFIDTQIDSEYNTYKNRGLPPGPIGNPGLSAIRAAIYPKDSSYLYYLSAPNGRTIFSKTFEEHNSAKAKYLQN